MTEPIPVTMIDLPAEYRQRRDEYESAMRAVCESGMFVLGQPVAELERQLADYVGVDHAVTCGNGTEAMILALRALGVGRGDEVVTTPFTFFATTEVILNVGAKPVFVDIDPVTFNLDAGHLEAAITPRTKAVLAVSLFGQPADIEAIRAVAQRHDLITIDDAAQSFGATYHGHQSGSLSRLSTTSFFPTKPLGCFGDGGACFTSEPDLAEQMKMLRHHGDAGRYDHQVLGWNSRLDTIQAAVLQVKLRHLPADLAARQRVAGWYDTRLGDLAGVVCPRVAEGRTSVYAQYSVRVAQRDAVLAAMRADGIPASVHYPLPVYRQKALIDLGYGDAHFPEAERAAREVLCLPIHPLLTEPQVDRVVASLRAAVAASQPARAAG